MLSEEQTKVKSEIISGKNIILTGKAGSGKTHLLNTTREELKRLNHKFLCTCFTASSARLVGGTTIHSLLLTRRKMLPDGEDMSKEFLCVERGLEKMVKSLDSTESAFRYKPTISNIVTLSETSVFFIDEISMVSPELFYAFVTSVKLARRFYSHSLFKTFYEKNFSGPHSLGGINKFKPSFILSGDFFQIAPVCVLRNNLKRKKDSESSTNAIQLSAQQLLDAICREEDAKVSEKYEIFKKIYRKNMHPLVDVSCFTLSILRKIASKFSTWELGVMKSTRYVFDDFVDLVPPSFNDSLKRNAFLRIQKEDGLESLTLSESFRQKGDTIFQEILDLLRIGGYAVWSQRDCKYIDPSRKSEVPVHWPKQLKDAFMSCVNRPSDTNSTRIYLKNDEATSFNKKQLETLSGGEHSVIRPQEFYGSKGNDGKVLKTELKTMKDGCLQAKDQSLSVEVLHRIKEFKDSHSSEMKDLDPISFKQGARVIITKNIDKEKGVINGRTGQIIGAVFGDDGTARKLKLRFEDGTDYVLDPIISSFNIGQNEYYFIRYMPIILGWAITTCRCQGMTLESVEIHLSMSFTSGHLYTAVSRATSLSGLNLILPLTKKTCKPLSFDFFMDNQALACHPVIYSRLERVRDS